MATAKELAQSARNLMVKDGEWTSPEHEESRTANRAAAMQQAIKQLAEAILILTSKQ